MKTLLKALVIGAVLAWGVIAFSNAADAQKLPTETFVNEETGEYKTCHFFQMFGYTCT